VVDQALVERDRRFWSARVRALTLLAGADALAVVLPLPDGRYVSFAEHNVGQDRSWLGGEAQELVRGAMTERDVRTGGVQVALGDGRVATSLVAAPVPWDGRVVAALVELREASATEAAVGATAEDLAELVGLELAVSSALQRADQRTDDAALRRALEDRRHALALYEVSRLALGAGGAVGPAAMIAEILGLGVVGVWVEEEGSLRLDDGHGYAAEPPRVRVDADGILARIVRERSAQRVHRGPDEVVPWLGPAEEAIGAPLGGGSAGLLVLGQPARPFGEADLAIAAPLAEAVGVALARRRAPTPASQVAPRPAPAPEAAAPSTPPARAQPRRRWVVPVFVVAVLAAGAGTFAGEPLVFVLAGLLLLVAVWGWSA
jgi:hypothetical protein